VSRGDYIAGGPAPTLLTTVRSVDPVHVYFTGDEQVYLRYGATAVTRPAFVGLADETGYPHEAQIDFVDNRVDPATGTIRVRAVLANPDHRFVPGLYARVRLSGGTAVRALLIDDKAVLTDQDRKFVYTIGAGDVATRKDVQLGRLVDGMRVIRSGLAPGDRVIVRGIQKVFPGAKLAVETVGAAGDTQAPQPGGPT
jgi:multidrug efflux system membrane fusion protein